MKASKKGCASSEHFGNSARLSSRDKNENWNKAYHSLFTILTSITGALKNSRQIDAVENFEDFIVANGPFSSRPGSFCAVCAPLSLKRRH